MGYDPVRDSILPSPVDSSRQTPEMYQNGRGSRDVGRNGPYYPPAFHQDHDHYPPGPASLPIARSTSGGGGGLKSLLLNDEPVEPRMRSEQRSSMSSTSEDQQQQFSHLSSSSSSQHRTILQQSYPVQQSSSRNSLQGLLNSTPLAPPISHSSSASSHRTSSPSNNSPAAGIRPHPAYLTPATPTAAGPRHSQSPFISASPAAGHHGLPVDPVGDQYPVPEYLPGPSRRSMTMDPYQQHSQAPYSLLQRSPSVSISPRGQPQSLPPHMMQNSRPSSSNSTSTQPFAYQPPTPGRLDSPARMSRNLSEDFSRSSSGAPVPARIETTMAIHSSYSPSWPTASAPPPSPPMVKSYDPVRKTPATKLLQPISQDEVEHLRAVGLRNNPLRRKKKPPLPSWSAPSPSTNKGPIESDSSYFPSHHRATSVAVARHSTTPGAATYPPVSEDLVATPSYRPRDANGRDGRSFSRKRSLDEQMNHMQDSSRRKVSESQYVGNAGNVADHYNARPEVGVAYREFSPIIGLKKFNNWVKSVLIGKFAYRARNGPGAKVLDIGCGKGGDLNKWKQARIALYVGMDLAATSIDQARDRYGKMGYTGFQAFFFAHDCYSQSITDALPDKLRSKDMYDNVTMQFCMHYAFESASKARMMVENVSRYLRPGGRFIGTVPDSELLLEKLGAIPEEAEQLAFGNACYSVIFEERKHKGIYGHSYHFYLQDAVEGVPEYIVNWDNFVSLANEYRLKIIYKKSFHEILNEEKESRDFGPLLGRMGVVNEEGASAMDSDQWEAANLYMAFAFEKF